MTITFPKTLIACAAFSVMTCASNAYAGPAFNKYPADTASFQEVGKMNPTQSARQVTVVKATPSIKRILKPLPKIQGDRVSLATDHRTANKLNGFNKMASQAESSAKAMPTFFHKGALVAR